MRLRFGSCVFDSDLRELSRNGERVPLTPKAFTLLEALIEARPQPLSREALVALLWPDAVVEPGNLHNLVSEIRGAVGDEEHRVIRTVHRFGYAFEGAGATEETPRFAIVVEREEIALRPGENTIGRDPSDSIVIDEPEISRHHARIIVQGSRATLEDLGSKNGTFVGTERISAPTELQPGAAIVIGKKRLTFRIQRSAVPTKTAT